MSKFRCFATSIIDHSLQAHETFQIIHFYFDSIVDFKIFVFQALSMEVVKQRRFDFRQLKEVFTFS